MGIRRLHRMLGIVMLLPFFGWAVTGFIFFIKPGYAGAYDLLSTKFYPLESVAAITPRPEWLEFRCVRTILGLHLIVRTSSGWSQFNLDDLTPRPVAAPADITRLINDAMAANSGRYGTISSLHGLTAVTSTGVQVTLDWNRLALQQTGKDTERIDVLYKIHYLQWTGMKSVDRVLGMTGLVLLVALAAFGAKLAIRPRSS